MEYFIVLCLVVLIAVVVYKSRHLEQWFAIVKGYKPYYFTIWKRGKQDKKIVVYAFDYNHAERFLDAKFSKTHQWVQDFMLDSAHEISGVSKVYYLK